MRLWLFIAGIDGALAVAMAALGAHRGPAGGEAASWFASAQAVHMAHALALLGVAALAGREGDGRRRLVLHAAGGLFVAGSLLFAGTIYMQALGGAPPLPFAAPAGGTMLICGWLALAGAALNPGRPNDRP